MTDKYRKEKWKEIEALLMAGYTAKVEYTPRGVIVTELQRIEK